MRETVRKDWWGRVGCGRVRVWEGERRKGKERKEEYERVR